jgi:hypothetical protein
MSLGREDDDGRKGEDWLGTRIPHIPRAMTRRVDQEKSIFGMEGEEPK